MKTINIILTILAVAAIVNVHANPVSSKSYAEWNDGLSDEESNYHYQEIYDLTCYLLKTYSGSNKTFLLGHWEGDWALLGKPYTPQRDPSEESIKGMIEWLNIRQKAVDDAKNKTSHINR